MDTRKKIVGQPQLLKQVAALRRKRKKIAFTNGCFDILHAGHVRYLEAAKTSDRILVVGLNSDASVRNIKGPRRPFNPQEVRAQILAALECVDFVTIFSEDTPVRLITAVQPDVLIKGADYKGKFIAGEDVVKARGGRVELIRLVADQSTTGMIARIRERD